VIAAVAAVSLGFAAGPAFAGDSVVWAEEARNGAVRIVMSSPGREPLLMHRIPPPTARRTRRGLIHVPAALGASHTRYAALVHTSTVTQSGSDSVSEASTLAAVGGPLSGPAAVLSGSIPRRGDAPCAAIHGSPDGVAVDGDRVAVAERVVTCDEGEPRPARVSVSGRDPVPVGTDVVIDHVELAGRYLAWLLGDELVVYDLDAGAVVLRVAPRDAGARFLDDMALRDDGTVALLASGRLALARPGTPGVRVLDRRASGRGVAIAGERLLYERTLDADPYVAELVVRPVDGGPARRLARFHGERRRRVGDLDLDAARAAWAWQRVGGPNLDPRGPARVVVRAP
jgi:hypothetical protein